MKLADTLLLDRLQATPAGSPDLNAALAYRLEVPIRDYTHSLSTAKSLVPAEWTASVGEKRSDGLKLATLEKNQAKVSALGHSDALALCGAILALKVLA